MAKSNGSVIASVECEQAGFWEGFQRLLAIKLTLRRLLVNPDTPEAWAIDLEPGTLSLGRSEENDVPIEHPSISSAHCRITVRDSSIWIKDLGSTAGTFVEGELVEEGSLKPGQIIRLGEIAMRYESGAPEDNGEPLPAPPLTPRTTPLPAATASGFCKFHPRIPGRFACLKCARAYCELCVNTRAINGVPRKYCRHCGSECQPMQPQVQRAEAPPGFLRLLPRALIYPFQGSGVILLLAGTAFFYILGYLPIIGFLLSGYLFNYAKSIITSTAEGRDDPPDWPDFSDWKEDILGPYFQLFVLMVLSFGPSYLVAGWQAWSGTNLRLAYFIALGFGLLLAPMGMLALAMFDSVAVLNPIALTASIMRVPRQYLIAAAAFEMVLVLHWFAEGAIQAVVLVPFLPGLITAFLNLYFVAVGMRVLGLLYLSHRVKFGWFSRLSR